MNLAVDEGGIWMEMYPAAITVSNPAHPAVSDRHSRAGCKRQQGPGTTSIERTVNERFKFQPFASEFCDPVGPRPLMVGKSLL